MNVLGLEVGHRIVAPELEIGIYISFGETPVNRNIMRKELIFRAEILVDSNDSLVCRNVAGRNTCVVCRACGIRRGHVLVHDVRGHVIQPACRDDVIRKRRAGEQIRNRFGIGREIAGPLSLSQHDRRTGRHVNRAQPFIARKEERLVVNDGTSRRRAKLVLLQDVFGMWRGRK